MEHTDHPSHTEHASHHDASWATAVAATLHCLTGCAIGEVLGMVLEQLVGLVDLAERRALDRAGVRVRLRADDELGAAQRDGASAPR